MKRIPRRLAIRSETILNLTQLGRARGGLPTDTVPPTTAHSDECNTTTNNCTQTEYCPDTGFTCTF